MTRNLKALGLALVAMLALSATAASTASAQVQDRLTLDGGEENAVVTATSHDNVFRITSLGGVSLARFECTTSRFTAAVQNNATEVTSTVSYAGTTNVVPHTNHCSATVGSVTVDMNSCGYILTGNTSREDPGPTKDAVVSVECTTPGDEIRITNAGCEVTVPPQTPTSGGVTYTNENNNGKWDVKVTATVTGITFTSHGPACAAAGIPAEGQTADYNGTATVRAFQPTGVHTHNSVQVGITSS